MHLLLGRQRIRRDITMKKLIKLTAVLLALMIPAGCGSKVKTSETVPTAEAIEATAAAEATPAATPEAATPAPAAIEQTEKKEESKAENPVTVPEQDNTPKIAKATAEKLVLEATGASGLKLVAEGDAYVFDCYQGNDYMGTVEVNATTGELTFQ